LIISKNKVYRNNPDSAINLYYCSETIISNNILFENLEIGILLEESSNNRIEENIVYDGIGNGVHIFGTSPNNVIKNNDFARNNQDGGATWQAFDEGTNNSFLNNYWSDSTGTGFYSIDGSANNFDDSPSMNPIHLSAPGIISPTSENSLLKDNVSIKWTESDDAFDHPITYTLFYSSDNGFKLTEIVSGLNTTQYTFDTNILPEDKLIIFRIDVIDSIGFISRSEISSTFELWTKPTIPTVLFPNGGETFNEPLTITWEESFDAKDLPITYSIYYSADGGATWNLLKEELMTTSFFWNTTVLPNGLSYLIKIVAINSVNQSNEDISDATFAIQNATPSSIIFEPTRTPSLAVLSIIGVLLLLSINNKRKIL
jgi:parallel beta-helix repeat protein